MILLLSCGLAWGGEPSAPDLQSALDGLLLGIDSGFSTVQGPPVVSPRHGKAHTSRVSVPGARETLVVTSGAGTSVKADLGTFRDEASGRAAQADWAARVSAVTPPCCALDHAYEEEWESLHDHAWLFHPPAGVEVDPNGVGYSHFGVRLFLFPSKDGPCWLELEVGRWSSHE